MSGPERESILKMQAAIRATRDRMGLPAEGSLHQGELLEALRGNPPIHKIVGFVKKSIGDDVPLSARLEGLKRPLRRIDKKL